LVSVAPLFSLWSSGCDDLGPDLTVEHAVVDRFVEMPDNPQAQAVALIVVYDVKGSGTKHMIDTI
jgi:hypothetical protein